MNLIISDFDGTLYDENYEKNIQYLNETKEKSDYFKIINNFLELKKKLY